MASTWSPIIVEHAQLPPGYCILTGVSSGPFLAAQLDIEDDLPGRGQVYVSRYAVEQAARLFGWTSPGAVDRLRADVRVARERQAEAEALVAEVQAENEALRRSFAALTGGAEVPIGKENLADPNHPDHEAWRRGEPATTQARRDAARAARAAKATKAVKATKKATKAVKA